MRIVSLLSSATEIVCQLGLQDQLLGISHECDYPPAVQHLPRVSRVRFDPSGLSSAEIDAAVRGAMERYGSVYEVDAAQLRDLAPELVLTQAVCEVCAVPTFSVEAAVAGTPHPPRVVSLDAHSLAGILGTIMQVAEAAGVVQRGRQLVEALRARLDAVARRRAGRRRPRVLALEWLDPPFLVGHWVPEMVEAAGGECLLGHAGARSRQATWEEIGGLDPDVLLVEPCGYDLARAVREARTYAEPLRRVAPRAVIWAADSAFFSRSGPRVVEGVEALAGALLDDPVQADAGAVVAKVGEATRSAAAP